jgi:hypothetical protein
VIRHCRNRLDSAVAEMTEVFSQEQTGQLQVVTKPGLAPGDVRFSANSAAARIPVPISRCGTLHASCGDESSEFADDEPVSHLTDRLIGGTVGAFAHDPDRAVSDSEKMRWAGEACVTVSVPRRGHRMIALNANTNPELVAGSDWRPTEMSFPFVTKDRTPKMPLPYFDNNTAENRWQLSASDVMDGSAPLNS